MKASTGQHYRKRISRVIDYIWLPQSGEEAADFPPFEGYLNDPKTTPPGELLARIHCLLS